MNPSKILVFALFLVATASAHAVNKCVEADGRITYTDEACSEKSVTSKNVKTNFTKINPLGTGPLSIIYAQHVKAMKSGDKAAFLSNMSEDVRVNFDGTGPEKFQYHIEKNLPVSYDVTLENIHSATQGTLGVKVVMSDKSSNKAGSGMDLYMQLEMVKERGAWKIDSESARSFKSGTKHVLNNADESWRLEIERAEAQAAETSSAYSSRRRRR